MQTRENSDEKMGPRGEDGSPRNTRGRSSGLDRARTPPHEKNDPTPQVIHVIVDTADIRALEAAGGPDVVAEVFREAIERDGLHNVLKRIRHHAEA